MAARPRHSHNKSHRSGKSAASGARGTKGGATQRQQRVGEEIRHALVDIFTSAHFRDPDLSDQSITVSDVRPSPDFRNATVYVTTLGGIEVERTVKALNRAAAFVRHELSGRLHIKHLPALHFEADRSFDEASHITDLLRTPAVSRDLATAPDGTDSADTGNTPTDPDQTS